MLRKNKNKLLFIMYKLLFIMDQFIVANLLSSIKTSSFLEDSMDVRFNIVLISIWLPIKKIVIEVGLSSGVATFFPRIALPKMSFDWRYALSLRISSPHQWNEGLIQLFQ